MKVLQWAVRRYLGKKTDGQERLAVSSQIDQIIVRAETFLLCVFVLFAFSIKCMVLATQIN